MKKRSMGVGETMMTLCEAVIASMRVIRADQDSLEAVVLGTEKEDGSEYTGTDVRSEDAGCLILERLGLPIWTEERKRPDLLGTVSRMVLYDPLDGTHYFKSGMYGVTVIASVVPIRVTVVSSIVFAEE